MSYCRGIVYVWEGATNREMNCVSSLHRGDVVFHTESKEVMVEHLTNHLEDAYEIMTSVTKANKRLREELGQ